MEAWLPPLQYGHWWTLAVIFLLLEVTAPAFFFLWLGVAAGITGALLLFLPEWDWKSQVVCFSALSVLSLGISRYFFKRRPPVPSDRPHLNQRSARLLGRRFILVEPIQHGIGRIQADGSEWPVQGPESPAGVRVTVVAITEGILHVELTPNS